MKYLSYFLPVFFIQIGLGITGPVLPDIKSYFGISMAATGLIMSFFGLARAIFDLPGGVIAQRLKPATGMALGITLTICGHFFSALAKEYSSLILGRFIAGMGSAIFNVVILTFLTRQTNYSNRGKILGINMSFILAGVSVGPAVGGLLGSQWGWRSVFFFSAATALIALAIIMVQLLYDRKTGSKIPSGTVEGPGVGNRPGGKDFKINMPAVITVNFVTFVLLFALEGFNNTIIPLYGSLTLKLPPDVLGLIIASGVIMRFIVGLAGGILSDKYGRIKVLVPCLVTAGLGILATHFAFNWWTFLAAVLIFAVGRMGNNVPLALLGDLTPSAKIGWMTALNRFIADGGLALGPLALGLIADRWGFMAAGYFAITLTWLVTLILWLVFRRESMVQNTA